MAEQDQRFIAGGRDVRILSSASMVLGNRPNGVVIWLNEAGNPLKPLLPFVEPQPGWTIVYDGRSVQLGELVVVDLAPEGPLTLGVVAEDRWTSSTLGLSTLRTVLPALLDAAGDGGVEHLRVPFPLPPSCGVPPTQVLRAIFSALEDRFGSFQHLQRIDLVVDPTTQALMPDLLLLANEWQDKDTFRIESHVRPLLLRCSRAQKEIVGRVLTALQEPGRDGVLSAFHHACILAAVVSPNPQTRNGDPPQEAAIRAMGDKDSHRARKVKLAIHARNRLVHDVLPLQDERTLLSRVTYGVHALLLHSLDSLPCVSEEVEAGGESSLALLAALLGGGAAAAALLATPAGRSMLTSAPAISAALGALSEPGVADAAKRRPSKKSASARKQRTSSTHKVSSVPSSELDSTDIAPASGTSMLGAGMAAGATATGLGLLFNRLKNWKQGQGQQPYDSPATLDDQVEGAENERTEALEEEASFFGRIRNFRRSRPVHSTSGRHQRPFGSSEAHTRNPPDRSVEANSALRNLHELALRHLPQKRIQKLCGKLRSGRAHRGRDEFILMEYLASCDNPSLFLHNFGLDTLESIHEERIGPVPEDIVDVADIARPIAIDLGFVMDSVPPSLGTIRKEIANQQSRCRSQADRAVLNDAIQHTSKQTERVVDVLLTTLARVAYSRSIDEVARESEWLKDDRAPSRLALGARLDLLSHLIGAITQSDGLSNSPLLELLRLDSFDPKNHKKLTELRNRLVHARTQSAESRTKEDVLSFLDAAENFCEAIDQKGSTGAAIYPYVLQITTIHIDRWGRRKVEACDDQQNIETIITNANVQPGEIYYMYPLSNPVRVDPVLIRA